jgi:hypothetical protein
MAFTFRPAKREAVGLLIGLAGASGSGKTYSALRLAKGLAQSKPFCLIDTEAGRAKHYADQFAFDHGDLHAPFSPAAYAEAIAAADAAGYPVIVVDSASHEHAGEGGILDMQEAELNRMAGDDWKKREAVKMASWVKPKMEHKRMVQKLLQVRAHLILCFRAEAKIEMVKVNGKMEVRPKQTLTSLDGWIPICEKSLPFELTASFLLLPDAPGIPQAIKLQEQHRPFFPVGQHITEAAGVSLAQWAAGGAVQAPKAAPKPAEKDAQSYTGLYEHTVSQKKGALMVWDLTIDGQVFSTVNEQLAMDAKRLEKQRVAVTYAPTSKGGLRLLTIALEAVAEEALR